MKIAIIGAGISGLTTAFYIKNQRDDVKIKIFEAESEVGGKMRTHKDKDFLIEIGSNGFLSNKPDTLELVKESGCENLLLRSEDNARKRFIFKESLCELPESPKAFLKTPLLSFGGKLRVLCEPFISPKKDDSDETLQSFGYRRVGKEMSDVFLDAMVAGIFASTPSKISVNAAFPAVVKLEKEYGGLFKGMRKKKKKDAGPGGVLMSFKGGVSSFVERLAENFEIETEKEIKSIEKIDNGYLVDGEEFDIVILSTPAFVSSELLKKIDEEISLMLKDIEYSPISVVGLGYDDFPHDLQGFGLLTTSSAKKEILGVLWDSSIFNDRAPKGKKLLRVMIGGQRNPDNALKSEEELVDMAIEGIKETMGVYAKPDIAFAIRHERGIPNYRVGHLERMNILFDRLNRHEGLYLSSNAYFGVGLNDCVSNAKKVAQKVVEEL